LVIVERITLRRRGAFVLGVSFFSGSALIACAAVWGFDDPTLGANEADGGIPDRTGVDATDASLVIERSCTDVREAGLRVDGTYAIDVDGPGPAPPFIVHCHNMATVDPTEYLELPANVDAGLPSSNVSGFVRAAGTCMPEGVRRLVFLKVRLNVPTLRIDPTDRTFAYFENGDAEPDPRLEFGSAGSCVTVGDSSGRGNVNLVGTPFRMTSDTKFVPEGYGAGGTSTFSADRKRVDLTGGGFAGWNKVPADAGGIGLEFAP
jgi:hypothetical protein